jgi:hypothetical protein
MQRHEPVDNVVSLRSFSSGFLCSCGRTILGKNDVKEHFGNTPDPKEVRQKRLLNKILTPLIGGKL